MTTIHTTIQTIHEWILSLTDDQYAILVLFATWVVASVSGFIIGRLSKRRRTATQEGIEQGYRQAKEVFDLSLKLIKDEALRTCQYVRDQCDEKLKQAQREYEAGKRELKLELEQQAIAHGAGTYRQLDENDDDDYDLMELLDAGHGDTVFVWRDQLTQDQRAGLFTFQTRTFTKRTATPQPAPAAAGSAANGQHGEFDQDLEFQLGGKDVDDDEEDSSTIHFDLNDPE